MPEIPAHQDIDLSNGGQGNVEHVVAEARGKYAVALIPVSDSDGFLRDR
jgi:hypothetical protein